MVISQSYVHVLDRVCDFFSKHTKKLSSKKVIFLIFFSRNPVVFLRQMENSKEETTAPAACIKKPFRCAKWGTTRS
jgi:hypothetical protein